MLIGVYGSLKEGKFNHYRLNGAKMVSKEIVSGQLYTNGIYPALVLNGAKEVLLEVYDVPLATFLSLNDMEYRAGYRLEGTIHDTLIWVMDYAPSGWTKINNF